MQQRTRNALIGLLFTVGAGLLITLARAEAAPARYTADATFSINWNQMPPDKELQAPEQTRREFETSLARFKVSKQFVHLLSDRCGLSSSESASIEKELGQHLKVTPAGTTNDCSFYRVSFGTDNQTVGLEAVNLLSSRFVARLNNKAKSHYATEALKSWDENVKNRDEEDSLRGELASLLQQQDRAFSQERQARIEEMRQELNVNDIHKTFSGLLAFVNGVAIFSNPAKVEQEGAVTKR